MGRPHEADNLAMAMLPVASTRSVALLPAYAQNFLPWSVIIRPYGRRCADNRSGRRAQQSEYIASPEAVPVEARRLDRTSVKEKSTRE